jgi:hypothetical protein
MTNHYFDFFAELPSHPVVGWKSADRLAEAQRGDIIAWALEASIEKPGDTGHVVIGFRFNSHAHLHLEPIAIGRVVH